MSNKFYGKYRAIVTNNEDPEQWGRIKVKCPSVIGDFESAWCMPCVPFLCNDEGIFKIPNVQDGVWIEFEGGNLSKPIYVGGWFNPKRMPHDKYEDAKKQFCLRTRNGQIIRVDDNKNLISLENKDGGKITIEKKTVTITGDLKVTGNTTTKNLKATDINTSNCNLKCKC